MNDGEWVAFLGSNTAFALVLIGVDGFLLRLTRRAPWSRTAVRVSLVVGAIGAALLLASLWQWPAGIPAWVYVWSLVMGALVGFGLFALPGSVLLAVFAGYQRLRRPVG